MEEEIKKLKDRVDTLSVWLVIVGCLAAGQLTGGIVTALTIAWWRG